MLRINFSLYCLILLTFSGINLPIISSLNLSEEGKDLILGTEYLDKIPSNDYLIGPGDKLKIIVSREYDELTSIANVDGEGTIYLPKLNRVFVNDLTIKELNQILNKAFLEYIKYPSVEVQVINYRPIRVYVEGEIENPGVKSLKGSFVVEDGFIRNSDSSGSKFNTDFKNQSYFFPTVFDALRESGGITLNSDLSKIKIIRKNSFSKGGGKITTNLNFEKVLLGSDFSQNIRIYDSDIIVVQRKDKQNKKILRKAILSKINPRFLNVFVTGRVRNPGAKTVSKASTLNDAIDLAGGTKILKGPITFVRFNNDGSIDKRKFSYRRSKKRGSYGNPVLKEGDFIFIGDSALTAFNEVTSEITQPLTGLFSTYGLIKAITD